MINIIVYFIAFFVTVPILATLIMYRLAVKRYTHPLRAIHFAVNWTTILYIIADLVLIAIIFERQIVGIVFVILICALAIIVIMQWKKKTEIDFVKAFKLVWRVCFLVFLLLYIFLILLGIIANIFIY